MEKKIKLFAVGDSTLSSFSDMYYLPRYGYATQLFNYFNNNVEVVNYALSGRSSKSFLIEENYKKLTNEISKGDFLIIGFGHNDEKSDDLTRFSSALTDITQEGSFKYNLYNYYIKLAKEKGATPILCTPIVRCDEKDCYTKESGHITENGDYSKCIIELGKETNTLVIDLTKVTKELYLKLGFKNAALFHAATIKNILSLDKTHINIYGAKMISYLFVKELLKTNCNLKEYVLSDIKAPTILERVPNKDYKEPVYESINLKTYKDNYFKDIDKENWHGTAFGDIGGSAKDIGFIASIKDNEFRVGQHLDCGMNKGKIGVSSEGIGFLFTQMPKNLNFIMECDAKVDVVVDTKQIGFGIMLRDDIYLDQALPNPAILSNYVASGINVQSNGMNIVYSRENCILQDAAKVLNDTYKLNDTAHLKLERLGQVAIATVTYKGNTYTKTYTDFDFFAIDYNYMYIGLYATRGTVISSNNVSLTITGNAISA